MIIYGKIINKCVNSQNLHNNLCVLQICVKYITKNNNNKQPSIQLGIDYKRYMNSDMCDIVYCNMAEYIGVIAMYLYINLPYIQCHIIKSLENCVFISVSLKTFELLGCGKLFRTKVNLICAANSRRACVGFAVIYAVTYFSTKSKSSFIAVY